jgi:hypothetical protein
MGFGRVGGSEMVTGGAVAAFSDVTVSDFLSGVGLTDNSAGGSEVGFAFKLKIGRPLGPTRGCGVELMSVFLSSCHRSPFPLRALSTPFVHVAAVVATDCRDRPVAEPARETGSVTP